MKPPRWLVEIGLLLVAAGVVWFLVTGSALSAAGHVVEFAVFMLVVLLIALWREGREGYGRDGGEPPPLPRPFGGWRKQAVGAHPYTSSTHDVGADERGSTELESEEGAEANSTRA